MKSLGRMGSAMASELTLAVANAPTWLLGAVLLVLFVILLVDRVMPQDSSDRLAWWIHVLVRSSGRAASARGDTMLQSSRLDVVSGGENSAQPGAAKHPPSRSPR